LKQPFTDAGTATSSNAEDAENDNDKSSSRRGTSAVRPVPSLPFSAFFACSALDEVVVPSCRRWP